MLRQVWGYHPGATAGMGVSPGCCGRYGGVTRVLRQAWGYSPGAMVGMGVSPRCYGRYGGITRVLYAASMGVSPGRYGRYGGIAQVLWQVWGITRVLRQVWGYHPGATVSAIASSALLIALKCSISVSWVLLPQSLYIPRRKNRHGHWVFWMSAGIKNGLI